MSLEARRAGGSSQVPSFFFLHFFLFFFMTELLESGKAECALLIEERRRKPGDLFTREVSASRLGVADLRGMGPTPRKIENYGSLCWELYGQPGQ